MHVQYPMLFRVTNRREGKHSHCGVLEFVAQEGMCYMPQWVRALSLHHLHAAAPCRGHAPRTWPSTRPVRDFMSLLALPMVASAQAVALMTAARAAMGRKLADDTLPTCWSIKGAVMCAQLCRS